VPNRYVQRKVNFPSCDVWGRARVAWCKKGSSSSDLQSGHLSGWGWFLGICRSGDPIGYTTREDMVVEGVTQQGCFNVGGVRGGRSGGFVCEGLGIQRVAERTPFGMGLVSRNLP